MLITNKVAQLFNIIYFILHFIQVSYSEILITIKESVRICRHLCDGMSGLGEGSCLESLADKKIIMHASVLGMHQLNVSFI